jgi:hypothetical protein
MTQRYTYTTTLSWGGYTPTAELEVEVSYSVAWGSAGTGSPYYGPPENYDPGSPDEIEDVSIITINGKPGPWDLSYGWLTSEQDVAMVLDKLEGDHDEMIANASEIEEGRRDSARESNRESRRETP